MALKIIKMTYGIDMGYFLLKENLSYSRCIECMTDLKEEHSFLNGRWLNLTMEEPLIYEVECSSNEYLGHFFDLVMPVFSSAMIEQFRLAGIDNFQAYPAVLVNSKEKVQWKDYYAVNVLGLIDSVNLEESTRLPLMPGGMDDGIPSLDHFTKMVISPSKVKGALMFRELRSPEVIIFDDKLVKYLKKNAPPEGWRLKVKKLESKD